jgi:hypothetical protein
VLVSVRQREICYNSIFGLLGKSRLKNAQRSLGALGLVIFMLSWVQAPAQTTNATQIATVSEASTSVESSLPDEPQPQQQQPAEPPAQASTQPPPGPIVPRTYALMIEPWQKPQKLTVKEKFVFSFIAASRPVALFPALYSASYEQLTDDDPKYGSDSGAFAARFGAAMAHSVSTRIFADGFLASAFHQDPRYYRVANGTIMHRSLHSAMQAIIRRSDNGTDEANYSGLIGRGASAALVLAYYPPASQTARVVMSTWGISIASDAGGDLVLEFLPDLARKFPILRHFKVE